MPADDYNEAAFPDKLVEKVIHWSLEYAAAQLRLPETDPGYEKRLARANLALMLGGRAAGLGKVDEAMLSKLPEEEQKKIRGEWRAWIVRGRE